MNFRDWNLSNFTSHYTHNSHFAIELFDVLIGTLCAVCTSNHTKIYLGYKRRALSVEEEGRFFKKLARKFKVSLVDGVATTTDEQKVRIYELRR